MLGQHATVLATADLYRNNGAPDYKGWAQTTLTAGMLQKKKPAEMKNDESILVHQTIVAIEGVSNMADTKR